MHLVYQPPLHAIDRWEGGLGPSALSELTVAAEEAGFAAIALTDHPFPPDTWLANGGHHALDPFAALAFVAARTTRIRLLTNLVVAGYRNPYVTAKAAATVDVLSSGRLVLGMGAGYLADEFEVLGAEHSRRGKAFDAAIDAMRAAWTGDSVRRDAPFPAAGHTAHPRPAQPDGPPLWIGGNSTAARRRAAVLGDGWMPFQQPPEQAAVTGTDTLRTLDELAERVEDLGRRRRDAGRDKPLDVAYAPQRIGSAEKLLAFLDTQGAETEKAGATWLVWSSSARSFEASLNDLSMIAGDLNGYAPGVDVSQTPGP